jgi:hypothetical protein
MKMPGAANNVDFSDTAFGAINVLIPPSPEY